MFTIISGFLVSLMITIFGPDKPSQPPSDSAQQVDQDIRVPDDSAVWSPIEALGGGFKKHRQ